MGILFGNNGIIGTAYNITAMSQIFGFVADKAKKYMTSYVDSIPVESLADKFAATDYNPNTISDEDMKRYEEKGKFLMECKDYFKACEGQSEDMTLTACSIVGKLADHYQNNPAMLGYCVENFKMFFIKGDTIMDAANNIMVKSKEAQEQGKVVTGDMIKSWIVGQTVSGLVGDKSNKYVYSEENYDDEESAKINAEMTSDKTEAKRSYYDVSDLYPYYADSTSSTESKITDAYASCSDKAPDKNVSDLLYDKEEKTVDRYQQAIDYGLPTENNSANTASVEKDTVTI